MAPLVLVVEDDEFVAETLTRNLRQVDFEVIVARRGADGLEAARQELPDVIILDVVMPGMSGIDVCRHIRANPQLAPIPILFLTGKKDISDKVAGFEAGADDYLVKPFDFTELELRVRALLRRGHLGSLKNAESMRVGDLQLDSRTFEISTPAGTQRLTPVEFELMRFLMSSPGRVFSAQQLLNKVWDYPQGAGTTDLVRVHVRNIRAKIEPNPQSPVYLRNYPRRGYGIAARTET